MSSSTTTAWMEQKQLEEITENHRLSLRVFLHYLDETMQTTDNAHALLSALCNSYLDDKYSSKALVRLYTFLDMAARATKGRIEILEANEKK